MRMAALACLGLLALLAAQNPAHAAGAPAGTTIDNTAQVSYELGAASVTMSSNTVSLRVAEVFDVVVTALTPSVSVSSGSTGQVLQFRVTNTGNGSETFRLAALNVIGGDDFDPNPAAPAIWFDLDGNGAISPGDTPYTPGSNDPVLAADAFVRLLLVSDIPVGLANAARGLSRLTAQSRTATGVPGTLVPGAGDLGTDAVIGSTSGDGEANGEYLVSDLALGILKSVSIADPFGGTRAVPGARLTYQIVVTPTGSGTAANAMLNDPIPASTRFVPGSLRLNGGTLSDAPDADAGTYLSTPAPSVRVVLGNLTQTSGPQTIVFAVTID